MALPRPGTTPGDAALDGPPPSPAFEQGMNPGQATTPQVGAGGLGGLVPQLSSSGLPPQVLSGMLSAAEQMVATLDSFAQVTPDLAPDWAAAKEALLNAMAKVLQAGAAPPSATAIGSNFSGGGLDRGGMPAASGL